MNTESAHCSKCHRERTDEHDYNPMQVIMGQPLGWHSEDDGDLCPGCLDKLVKLSNGR